MSKDGINKYMRIKLRSGGTEYTDIVSYGTNKTTVLEHICAFLLATAPILQHYKGLYQNMGFTVLLICFPILLLQFCSNCLTRSYSNRCIISMIPVMIFQIYTAVIHPATIMRLFYILFMISIFLFIASGCMNGLLFFKYACNIITIATILIAAQYISHYIFNYTLNLRPLSFLVDEDTIWMRSYIYQQEYGISFYRPSAFFLEPSHLFLYGFPILTVLLLSPEMTKSRFKKAITVSLAMLLSTSGFGIVVVTGIWFIYLLLYRGKDDYYKKAISKVLNYNALTVFIIFVLVMIVAYYTIPIFQQSITRIFINENGSNAIDGRVRLASMYAQQIEGSAVFFGTSNATADIEFNLPGFFSTYIKWGLVGIALNYWFYLRGLFKLKKSYFWINAIIIAISYFTAHTHGTFYMLYFFIYLMEGYSRIGVNNSKITANPKKNIGNKPDIF